MGIRSSTLESSRNCIRIYGVQRRPAKAPALLPSSPAIAKGSSAREDCRQEERVVLVASVDTGAGDAVGHPALAARRSASSHSLCPPSSPRRSLRPRRLWSGAAPGGGRMMRPQVMD
ncbi:hypothetical protein Taro_033125 [Colocasia esculenta]|uniref:Uncharacterized protein n=1 Tax=Colocasia esculenta TaxID=4460 RepID=A0A843VT27_COLES|nr:hypothetical protein [Colocasia esculenta]